VLQAEHDVIGVVTNGGGPSKRAFRRFDQHGKVLVPVRDRIGAEIGHAAIAERRLAKIGKPRRIG
jgi:hypothetical protein